ncbi:MAG: two-component system, OmpR family, sensor kinase [Mycobacteriales bacterium]
MSGGVSGPRLPPVEATIRPPAGAVPGRQRRRLTLASQTTLVTIVVAAVAMLVVGLVSVGLVRSAGEADAQRVLSVLADNVSGALAEQPGVIARRPVRGQAALVQRFLRGTDIQYAVLGSDGGTLVSQPLTRDALSADEARAVVAGESLSAVRSVDGSTLYVEARPTSVGAVLLVQRRSRTTPFAREAVRRIGLALLIGLGVAVVAAVALARLLARPLKRAAAGAHALASGTRDVRVTPEGPSEVADVAEALNVLAAALARSEGRQREFLLSVSHELRTPLTAITGFAESLADGVTAGDEVRPVGATMLGEARRLERLVSDLLDLARLGAQDFRIDEQPVDLTALVRAAGDVWRARCEAVGVSFDVELPPYEVVTLTDPTRVRQILDGLAENALRVTPAGAPIVIALAAQHGWAALQVRDGGPGLTPDDCAVAFERSVLYERYRGVRRVGTGVGLALVHGLATRLGGGTEAGRAPEGGACFTVRLPLVAGRPSGMHTVPLRLQAGGGTGPVRPGR